MDMIDTASPRTEMLTFALGGEAFAVEAAIVSEILDLVPVTHVPHAADHAQGLINVRGKVVPLVDLKVCFGMARQTGTIDSRIIVAEIPVEDEPTIIGLLVDKVHEVAEVDRTAIEPTPRIGMKWRPEFIRGIGRRGDAFLIILDVDRVFACHQ